MKTKPGYVPCDCRDCMNLAIFGAESPSFCHACEAAGCELNQECCSPSAYGDDETEETEEELVTS